MPADKDWTSPAARRELAALHAAATPAPGSPMPADLPADLREAVGRAAHDAYRAQPHSKQHAPEDCPCRDGHDEPVLPDQPMAIYVWCLRCHRQIERRSMGCPGCRPGLRAWPDLTEAQREEFRAQGDPALSVLAPVLARAEAERARYAAALAHVESLGLHIRGCYAYAEAGRLRCAPECPTGVAKRAREGR